MGYPLVWGRCLAPSQRTLTGLKTTHGKHYYQLVQIQGNGPVVIVTGQHPAERQGVGIGQGFGDRDVGLRWVGGGVAPTPGQVLRVGVPVYDMGCQTQVFFKNRGDISFLHTCAN